jgi:hypothetical protein
VDLTILKRNTTIINTTREAKRMRGNTMTRKTTSLKGNTMKRSLANAPKNLARNTT